MSTVDDHLMKLREERVAREKARIEKLREINLKKYNKNEVAPNLVPQKLVKSNSISQIKTNVTSNIQVKRPTTACLKKPKVDEKKPLNEPKINYIQRNLVIKNKDTKVIGKENKEKPLDTDSKITKFDKKTLADNKKPTFINKINNDRLFDRKTAVKTDKILAEIKPFKKIDPKLTRRSIAVPKSATNIPIDRKSMSKLDPSKESVFERLYKPKYAPKKTTDEVEKLQNDPDYLKKVIKTSGIILKRHTCFETKEARDPTVRRSISAVHFKRISKNEASNCIHKWSSIGDKLNNQHLAIDEGSIKEEVFSAVKSECKRVKFMTPMSRLTPRPEELQTRLKAWLQKRGKSLDAYQHLQCFGLHHLPKARPLELPTPTQYQPYSDENKENIAVDSDSDDGSYTDNVNTQKDALNQGDGIDVDQWRQASLASESMYTEFNETGDLNETTATSADSFLNMDDLLVGALNDLTELLKEGFEWEQAARYMRGLRARWPAAPRLAAYWQCRAALEARRGDLHASVHCWEEAIAKGTERNVVEASLDTLLSKFMQLKISPNGAASKQSNSKMVDVKNVFKSTIIRFAVQQAKLRQSEAPMFTVTPVRRSGRLSLCPTPRGNTPRGNTPRGNTPRGNTPRGNTPRGNTPRGNTPRGNTPRSNKRNTPRLPLQICDTVEQVTTIAPQHVFTPNENLFHTP